MRGIDRSINRNRMLRGTACPRRLCRELEPMTLSQHRFGLPIERTKPNPSYNTDVRTGYAPGPQQQQQERGKRLGLTTRHKQQQATSGAASAQTRPAQPPSIIRARTAGAGAGTGGSSSSSSASGGVPPPASAASSGLPYPASSSPLSGASNSNSIGNSSDSDPYRALTPSSSDMAEWEELKRKVRTLESRLEVSACAGGGLGRTNRQF